MMKKFFLSAATMLFLTLSVSGQKVAVIDVSQVLASLPDYKKAQEDLDKVAQKWRGEIAQQQDGIKGMFNRYEAEKVLMSEDAKKKREDEIIVKEKEVREAQRVKFGPEGELFRKRQELVKPIQDKV